VLGRVKEGRKEGLRWSFEGSISGLDQDDQEFSKNIKSFRKFFSLNKTHFHKEIGIENHNNVGWNDKERERGR